MSEGPKIHEKVVMKVKRTARIRNSTILFVAERPNEVEIAEAQEEVSSVVVLFMLGVGEFGQEGTGAQLCKDAIEGCAGAAEGGQGDPGELAAAAGCGCGGVGGWDCFWNEGFGYWLHGGIQGVECMMSQLVGWMRGAMPATLSFVELEIYSLVRITIAKENTAQ